MKILLTGSSGFIGRNLKEKLSVQFDMYCPNRKELDLLKTEAVMDYVKGNCFDVVIHTANVNNVVYAETTPYDSLDGNLRMFFNLEKCKDFFDKMYYFGSGAEYDMAHYIPGMKEEYFGTHIPRDSYGFSKYIMSKECEKDNNIYDLRLFGVYGKYEEWERRFISNAICRALKGKDITIQKNVFFDYIWINDLCNIMQWFLKNEPEHKHYNVCKGEKIDLYSLACMVRRVLDIDCGISVKETGWKTEYTGNNDRLLREMGNYQFEGMEESIRELGEYYRANIDMIQEDKLV